MLGTIDWLGVAVATVAAMGIGAAWYGTFAKPWVEAAGFDENQRARVQANEDKSVYGIAALCNLVMAIALCAFIAARGGGVGTGFWTGLFAWLGFVATSTCVNHRFQFRPWALTAIDAGHFLAVLIVQGLILGWFLSP